MSSTTRRGTWSWASNRETIYVILLYRKECSAVYSLCYMEMEKV